jgi:energy-coupling factor transport system ATP-binding protein
VTPGIEAVDLSCRYPGAPAPALDRIVLALPPRTMTLVMGATGAGKSTLARCLARLVPCFTAADVTGDVRLGGASIVDKSVGELAGVVGMVFQDFEAQLFSTDVTQEIVFGLEQTGVPAGEMPARVAAALAAVGLAGFDRRDPTTLSGGEKQRLAIAGLLALRPDVLLLDEPTTDLDPAGRHDVLGVIDRATAAGCTVLLIEHDAAAVERADAVVLLHEGRIVAAGPPMAVLGDVIRCEAVGVRAPDVARVFAALGLDDPPLDVDAAAARLREARVTIAAPPRPDDVPAPREPLLRVEHATFRYPGGATALDDVSVDIGRGELVAVVGRNGSGKTTLVKHLNGLLTATSGRVILDGAPIAGRPLESLAQRVGYVFQDPDHQLFAATVGEEVAFGPRNLGLATGEVEARVDEALAAVGLDARDEDPFLLDKGARQRLAVAAVLALRPDVLVLDEPTTGLDHREQQRMLDLLARLHSAGRTIVIVTHTPWIVAELAERVLLMSGGRLRYDGPVRPFFADPSLLDAASFRAPDVTRLGQALGCTPLAVDELVAWARR